MRSPKRSYNDDRSLLPTENRQRHHDEAYLDFLKKPLGGLEIDEKVFGDSRVANLILIDDFGDLSLEQFPLSLIQ